MSALLVAPFTLRLSKGLFSTSWVLSIERWLRQAQPERLEAMMQTSKVLTAYSMRLFSQKCFKNRME
jgi:hypothetical protein